MLCFSSCDIAKQGSQEVVQEIQGAQEVVQETQEMGSYYVLKDGNEYGVYDGLPDRVGNIPDEYFSRNGRTLKKGINKDILEIYDADNYQLVKFHDETGQIIPEALRRGMSIIYEEEGSDMFSVAFISDVSDAGVRIGAGKEIDVSQVVGVRIIEDWLREVIYSPPSGIPPHMQDIVTHARIDDSTTEDIRLSALVAFRYTSGHAIVRFPGRPSRSANRRHMSLEWAKLDTTAPGLYWIEPGSYIFVD